MAIVTEATGRVNVNSRCFSFKLAQVQVVSGSWPRRDAGHPDWRHA